MGWRPLQGTYLSTHLSTEFFPGNIVLRVAQYHLTEFVLTNCAEQIHPQQRQQHRCMRPLASVPQKPTNTHASVRTWRRRRGRRCQ